MRNTCRLTRRLQAYFSVLLRGLSGIKSGSSATVSAVSRRVRICTPWLNPRKPVHSNPTRTCGGSLPNYRRRIPLRSSGHCCRVTSARIRPTWHGRWQNCGARQPCCYWSACGERREMRPNSIDQKQGKFWREYRLCYNLYYRDMDYYPFFIQSHSVTGLMCCMRDPFFHK